MKIQARQIDSFIKNAAKQARVVLLYGPDSGLVRERAKTIGLSVVTDLNDPFNVSVLSGEILAADPARLGDEARAISMMGGDRLVRVENATDKITPLLKDYLTAPAENTLVVIEAGELPPRSTLRALCEKSPLAAALPSYVEDERDLARLIREVLQESGLRAEPDALAFLASVIGGNRAKARGALEKLIVYKGDDMAPVTLEDARAVSGEAGQQSLDDLVFSTAGNRPAQAVAACDTLFEEGVSFVVILRALQNHFRRLHLARALMDEDETAETAIKKLFPPVFFKQEAEFKRQLQSWRPRILEKILARLMEVEAQCKRTNAPVESLCAQAVLGIAMMRN